MNTLAPTSEDCKKALILLAHGARDLRWREPFDKVQKKIQSLIDAKQARDIYTVELAFLEHMQPDIMGCVEKLYGLGYRQMILAPLFLGVGGHVRSDIPRLIEDAMRTYPDLLIHVKSPMADSDAVLSALVGYALA